MKNDRLLSVKDSAELLGISRQRIQALISNGRLPAQKIGNSYVIKEADLKLIEDRQTGRPPKEKKTK
jgi:excisionase family DNA binding protein